MIRDFLEPYLVLTAAVAALGALMMFGGLPLWEYLSGLLLIVVGIPVMCGAGWLVTKAFDIFDK